MMNFVNLAHCSFAMLGGYVAVSVTNDLGWPFLVSLPVALVAAAVASVAFERVALSVASTAPPISTSAC